MSESDQFDFPRCLLWMVREIKPSFVRMESYWARLKQYQTDCLLLASRVSQMKGRLASSWQGGPTCPF